MGGRNDWGDWIQIIFVLLIFLGPVIKAIFSAIFGKSKPPVRRPPQQQRGGAPQGPQRKIHDVLEEMRREVQGLPPREQRPADRRGGLDPLEEPRRRPVRPGAAGGAPDGPPARRGGPGQQPQQMPRPAMEHDRPAIHGQRPAAGPRRAPGGTPPLPKPPPRPTPAARADRPSSRFAPIEHLESSVFTPIEQLGKSVFRPIEDFRDAAIDDDTVDPYAIDAPSPGLVDRPVHDGMTARQMVLAQVILGPPKSLEMRGRPGGPSGGR